MAFNFFTAFHRALQDPESYFSFQKEMNSKAVEQTFFNSLSGKTSFDAVVLPEDINSTTYATGASVLRVRPLELHGFIIPEPCDYAGDPEKINKIISMHPVAYPDNLVPFNLGNENTPHPGFQAGQIVECFFLIGPQGAGKMRGLRYRNAKFSAVNNIDLTCLEGQKQSAQAAFNDGGYSQKQNDFTEQYLGPSNIIDLNLVADPKYSIPASGKKIMSPKNIVIHYGAGRNVIGEQKYGATKSTPAGYHFGVRRNGTVVQFMEPTRRVVHASSHYFNDNAVSINFENVGYEREGFPAESGWFEGTNEHSKHKGKWQPYTPEQYEKGGRLIAWLCKTFGMDPTGQSSNGQPTIVGHDYVTVKYENLDKKNPSKVKSDPGPAFSMEGIRNMAKIKMSEV